MRFLDLRGAVALARYPDVYFTPGYGAAVSAADGGVWRLAWAPERMLVPYLIQPITDESHDAVSPYGYSGVHVAADCPPDELVRCWTQAVDRWRDEGLVSMFLRFSPLEPASVAAVRARGLVTMVRRADTVTVATDRHPDEIWDGMEGRARTAIRKARRSGLEAAVRPARAEDLVAGSAFRHLYEQTMKRVDSSPRYLFPDRYYELLRGGLGESHAAPTAHRRTAGAIVIGDHRSYDPVKRGMDVLVAGTALLVLSPVLLAVWLAVALALGRPVLFRQFRPGKDGTLFELCKFRTMLPATAGRYRDEDRLTPFGIWLRRTSLDELPTLWNVLRGDMSLVGPRPLMPEYLDRYTPEQARRHEVRPGITGLAQTHGRNTLSWEEKFAHDVRYIDSRCFWLDLRILLLTVVKVLRREGISAEGHATSPEFIGTARSLVETGTGGTSRGAGCAG